MKKKSEWKEKVFTKNGISLLSQITVIILVFGLYILGDYLSFKGTMEFITDPVYWSTTTISLVLIIAVMITIRSMRKNDKIANSEDIANNMRTVQAVRKVVLINAYDEEFQAYIDKVNDDYKYETYINKITKKINRLNYLLISTKRKDKKLKKYEEMLKIPKTEVIKMHIKFKKITQTGLFSGVDGKLAVMNKYDTSTHETKDIALMVGYKTLMVYLLTAFSGTMIVNFIFNGWSALWGTLLKLFSLAFATTTAIKQADNFVDYNIEQALDNRLRVILGFVNSSEDIKMKVLEKLQDEQKQNKIEEKKESGN